MRKITDDGFGVVELILILLVVVAVGLLGWLGYNGLQSNKTTETSSTQKTVAQTTSTNAGDAQTYTNNTGGYKFVYKKTWKKTDSMNDEGVAPNQAKHFSITLESPDYKYSESGVGGHVSKGARIYVDSYKTTAKSSAEYVNSDPLNYAAINKKNTTLAGKDAVSYTVSYEGNPYQALTAVVDGKYYSVVIDYANDESLSKYSADYQDLIDSFKFL